MRNAEDRIAQLLRDVAADMPADPELERRTLRRSRHRRALNASLAGAIAAVLVVGSFAGLRVVATDRTQPAGTPPPTTSPEPSDTPVEVPAPVAETREAILIAVQNRDFRAMHELIDPMTFGYNFSDGGNPIPEWRDDPSVLDPIPAILALPPAAARHIEGYGTFYIWPYLVESDLAHLTQREIDDLHGLGYDDASIHAMQEGSGGYQGPRLAIDATGLWRNYFTVVD